MIKSRAAAKAERIQSVAVGRVDRGSLAAATTEEPMEYEGRAKRNPFRTGQAMGNGVYSAVPEGAAPRSTRRVVATTDVPPAKAVAQQVRVAPEKPAEPAPAVPETKPVEPVREPTPPPPEKLSEDDLDSLAKATEKNLELMRKRLPQATRKMLLDLLFKELQEIGLQEPVGTNIRVLLSLHLAAEEKLRAQKTSLTEQELKEQLEGFGAQRRQEQAQIPSGSSAIAAEPKRKPLTQKQKRRLREAKARRNALKKQSHVPFVAEAAQDGEAGK